MTTFSVTEMGGFKDCRRRWWQESLNGEALEPWLPAKPLILGTLVHAVMADWSVAWHHGDRSLNLPVDAFNRYWLAAEQAIRERYAQKYGGNEMSDAELDALYGNDVRDLGHEMIANYAEFYGQPYPSGYELVEVEQTITVPIPGTEHCTCCSTNPRAHTICALDCYWCFYGPNTSRRSDLCGTRGDCLCRQPHFIEGTFDMLLADKRDRIVVPDHKTYEKRPSEMDNAQNDQFLRYLWITSQALPGREVVGTLYNGLWKRRFPVLGKDGKPLKNASTGEPYELGDLFFRDLIPHDEEEILLVGYYLPGEAQEMEAARLDPRLRPPRRSWSTCPNCSIQDQCVAMSRGEDISDFRADYTHREKTPAWRAAV